MELNKRMRIKCLILIAIEMISALKMAAVDYQYEFDVVTEEAFIEPDISEYDIE